MLNYKQQFEVQMVKKRVLAYFHQKVHISSLTKLSLFLLINMNHAQNLGPSWSEFKQNHNLNYNCCVVCCLLLLMVG